MIHKMRKEKIKTMQEFIKKDRLSLKEAVCKFIDLVYGLDKLAC